MMFTGDILVFIIIYSLWQYNRKFVKMVHHSNFFGGARGVMVIVTGYGHGGTSSIPGQDWLHFT